MEQEIIQCHDIAAAEKICFDFQRKTAAYSEPDILVRYINKSWKKQLKFQKLYRDRSQPQATSVTDPVSVRVFCGPTTCRAGGNEVSAMNILTRKSVPSTTLLALHRLHPLLLHPLLLLMTKVLHT